MYGTTDSTYKGLYSVRVAGRSVSCAQCLVGWSQHGSPWVWDSLPQWYILLPFAPTQGRSRAHRYNVRESLSTWADIACSRNWDRLVHPQDYEQAYELRFPKYIKCQACILGWAQQKNWTICSPDKVATGICSTPKTNRTIAMEELLEECAAWKPHPAACVDTEICIQ